MDISSPPELATLLRHQPSAPIASSTVSPRPRRGVRGLSRPSTAPSTDKVADMLPSSKSSTMDDIVIRDDRDNLITSVVKEEGFPATVPADNPPNTQIAECAPRPPSYYDWATFINTYATGRWDPLRTPNPPTSSTATQQIQPISSEDSPPHLAPPSTAVCPSRTQIQITIPPRTSVAEDAFQSNRSVTSSNASPINPHSVPPTPYHWPRAPFTDLRPASASSNQVSSDQEQPGASSNSELAAAAATMRVAASRINLSPLFVPSPERELTDPMRDHTTIIPGSYFYDAPRGREPTGNTRQSQLPSFLKCTQDVDELTIDEQTQCFERPVASPQTQQAFTACAPMPRTEIGDYPGSLEPISEEISKETQLAFLRAASPFVEMGALSVPALPHMSIITRQTSSPLPATVSSADPLFATNRHRSEGHIVTKANWSGKEEQLFVELGYLAPPNPPDECERRRALHKFNIWQTGPDLNFDRIAHLAKLVFNTKSVVVSLIDGKEQWFKSEWGMKMAGCARINSFCGHSILQRGDEPMVILDSHQDWRFKKNPLVTGETNVRFYAGAPLRTQDGFNIGSLAVICDHPRQDFTPRQRHTLKEFAAIAMRELELWRDKIQLRIRDRIQDSMEQFSRECLEIDTAAQAQKGDRSDVFVNASMDKVHDRAAKLIKRTLDVEGVIIMDVSHCEVLETISAESTVSVVMHYGDPQTEAKSHLLSLEEYRNLTSFFAKHPDGKISEGIISHSLRPFLPIHIQYALTVPIFNIDKRPFALVCAYNASDNSKRFLEGHELSYLRAIGVIILSAVLKRRMIFADKAKSLFISNISHELRTPLHGILAAAELLTDSHLNHNQASFLQTIQACGMSLVETVNHVLDFTKLVGNSKSDVAEHVVAPSKVDLVQLFEEAIDGCWVGHHARMAELQDSEIGSFYSPPKDDSPHSSTMQVETVVDIGRPERSWVVKCERGGIRRILMNLFSNSLKFTTRGFIHVALRQLPSSAEDTPADKIKIELTVHDTGKGISQNFLKNQLFQPFSQENPLQTGTGLGLAIVNSILQSKSVGGKVDVWSEEGVGTEVKVTFLAERLDPASSPEPMLLKSIDGQPPSASLVGFDDTHPGTRILYTVLRSYLVSWWGFNIQPAGSELGEVVILNNDPSLVKLANNKRDTDRMFVILSSSRRNRNIMAIASEYEQMGGFCRIVHKPGGPSRLESVLKLGLHARKIRCNGTLAPLSNGQLDSQEAHVPQPQDSRHGSHIIRRHSGDTRPAHLKRPINRRTVTAHSTYSSWDPPLPSTMSTISVGSGGTLRESSVGTVDITRRQFRVLVVEDNSILRSLLVKWLKTKGYAFCEAVDGRDGVRVFERDGPFDIVLLDLSMPVLDGVGATTEIRQIESVRAEMPSYSGNATRILALTGMSSLEDKQRAFEAGVDGYLVKPVAFKTLDEMFHKLGSS